MYHTGQLETWEKKTPIKRKIKHFRDSLIFFDVDMVQQGCQNMRQILNGEN